jgi:NAD(P)-dependent dehydrogenase (short-subunit alcohol dehydrogenase family)
MNQIDLKGRVAVVTGGAQGIGLAISQRLLASGARVVIWDIDAARLQQACAALVPAGADASVVRGEVVELTDDAAVAAATAKAMADMGRIDILVNNAGITGGNATTWALDPAVWRRVIEVNLIAPYLTCRHVVQVMMTAGYGRIINIASVAGKEGNPNASHYSASKAGLIALTKSLAKEVATKGVLVNAITPAVAKTAMFEQMTQAHIDYMLGKIPMGRFLEVQEVAAMVAWLGSEECSFSTGAVFDLTGGRATY